MKSKIIVILIFLMLTVTFYSIATNVDNVKYKQISNHKFLPYTYDDVPTWNIDDTWVYKIHDINIDDENDNKSIHIHIQIDELTLKVIDDTSLYNVEFEAKISGDYSIYLKEDNSTIDLDDIDIQGKLLGTKIKGNIFFTKSELGIKTLDYELSGILTVKINDLPDEFKIPELSFPIPIPATITTTVDFDDPYTILSFPLNLSNYWGLQGTNFTINGELQSVWLNILNIINNLFTSIGSPLLPEETAALLPVINIKEALEIHGIENIFEIPGVPSIFAIFSMDNITVPAGEFSTYNISVGPINLTHALGRIYYAPEIKNIVKISGQLGDILPFMTSIEMELIEYNIG
jgi:hypothetical protein